MTDANRKQRIAELFIRMQQYKERAWKASIARRPREALEHATLLQLAATELVRLIADEEAGAIMANQEALGGPFP